MQTLINLENKVVAVGEVTIAENGSFHVGDEVYQHGVMLINAMAPGVDFQWNGDQFVQLPPLPMPEADLLELKRKMVGDVDEHIAAIYNRWLRFEAEYVARESAARAFAAAGYEGACSVWVTSFAQPAGLQLQTAADRIISQADALRGALEQLGALRMLKYRILGAVDAEAAQLAHGDIIAQANAIAAGLQ